MTQNSEGVNFIKGEVKKSEFLGNYLDCLVQVHENTIKIKLDPKVPVKAGDEIV